MRTVLVSLALLVPAALLVGAWWLCAPYAPALSVLTGEVGPDGLAVDVTTAAVVLGSWFGAVVVAPGLALGAALFVLWQAIGSRPGRQETSTASAS